MSALSSHIFEVDCWLYNGNTTWLGIKFILSLRTFQALLECILALNVILICYHLLLGGLHFITVLFKHFFFSKRARGAVFHDMFHV